MCVNSVGGKCACGSSVRAQSSQGSRDQVSGLAVGCLHQGEFGGTSSRYVWVAAKGIAGPRRIGPLQHSRTPTHTPRFTSQRDAHNIARFQKKAPAPAASTGAQAATRSQQASHSRIPRQYRDRCAHL